MKLVTQKLLAPCENCKAIEKGKVGICLEHGLVRISLEDAIGIAKKYQKSAVRIAAESEEDDRVHIPEGYVLREEWQPQFTKQSVETLHKMKNEKRLRDLDSLVKLFAESGGKPLPEATSAILNNPRPCLITGVSASGKTLTTIAITKDVQNLFVLDVSGEYQDCQPLNIGGVFAFDWKNTTGRFRFIPQAMSEMSKLEADMIFRWLHLIKADGRLQQWTFVIEEAHRFKDLDPVQAFIIEGRKYCKVVIIVSTDYKPFENTCDLFKPQPLKTETAEGLLKLEDGIQNIQKESDRRFKE